MHDARVIRLAAVLVLAVSCGRGDPASRAPGRAPFAKPGASAGARASLIVSPGSTVNEEYVYDPAGNLLEMRTSGGSTPLSVTDFSPKAGSYGQLVTVAGTGFSLVPLLNTVYLNGSPVALVSASSTRLSFAVPAGATTGRITVASGGGTATSVDEFTVFPTVLISDFTPKLGKAGTAVTITGSDFDPDASGDSVTIGGGGASVTSASAGSLVATVGATATSGKIAVTTRYSGATSAADFFVIPGTLVASDIGFTGRGGPDAPAVATIASAGKAGLLLFDGVQNQHRSLFVTGVTLPGTTNLTVYDPAGASIFTGAVAAGQEYKFALPTLARSGAYTVLIQPAATSTGAASIRVFEDVAIALDPFGGPATMTVARGQNGRCTLAGAPGDFLALGYTSVVTTPTGTSVSLAAYNPNGSTLGSISTTVPGNWQLPELSAAGPYTITVQPVGTAAASLTLLLSAPITGKIVVDGPAVQFQSTRPGQSGRYTFAASGGEFIGVGFPAVASTPAGYVYLSVLKPDGSVLASTGPTAPGNWQLPQLPSTGTYTLAVIPRSGTTSNAITLLLSRTVSGTLAADGTPTRLQTSRVGQAGRYTFSATAGQSFTLQGTVVAGFSSGVTVAVYQPSGTWMMSTAIAAGGSGKLDLSALPASGTYVVTAWPSGVGTGTVDLVVQPQVTDTLVVGDPPKTLTLATAQNGRYTFAANSGDFIGVGFTALALTPGGGYVTLTLLKPDGTSAGSVGPSSPGSWQLPQALSTGTYTLTVKPWGISAATITFLLSRPITGTLAADGTPTRFETSRAGQSGRYTFTGVAGQSFTLQGTASTGLSSGVSVAVYQPNGVAIATGTVVAGGSSKLDLSALPASGTYAVGVVPLGVGTGTVDLVLQPQASDTLVVGDPPKTVTIATAQNGRYIFEGNSGDFIGVGYTTLALTPAGGSVGLSVLRPDGISLANLNPAVPGAWQLPQLPSTGTYTITVKPPGISAATMTFLLSRAVAGTLPTDGTPTRFETTRTGQAGRYTFTGTAGQSFTLQGTASSGFTDRVSVTVYQPNGVSMGSASIAPGGSGKVDLSLLPTSGTYAVSVVTLGVGTGTVDLALQPQILDTLVVGDPPKTLTLATGQNGRYTFAANSGDFIGFGYTTLTLTPAGGVTTAFLKPDGTQLAYQNPSAPGSWQLPQLPTTGTYTLTVAPSGVSAATMTVLLSRPITGTLATDGTPTRFETSRAGQSGRYTFTGAAGQNFTLLTTASTGFSRILVNVYQPSGAAIAGAWIAVGGSSKLDLSVLPASGTYTVTVVPWDVGTGTVDLVVQPQAADTLVVGDPPKALALAMGQNGRYTFAGNAGALLTLAVGSLSTTPTGSSVAYYLFNPSGSTLWSNATSSSSASWQLPSLPVTGTYTLAARPAGVGSAAFTLRVAP